MLSKILATLGLITTAVIGVPYWFGAAIEKVTAPENNTYQVGVYNYDFNFKENITEAKALEYKLDDKFISFSPVEIRVDGKSFETKRSSVRDFTDRYENVFGSSFDLKMNTSDRVWEKLI